MKIVSVEYFWDMIVHGEVDHWFRAVTYVATPPPPRTPSVLKVTLMTSHAPMAL
jgi:hypothetical protein